MAITGGAMLAVQTVIMTSSPRMLEAHMSAFRGIQFQNLHLALRSTTAVRGALRRPYHGTGCRSLAYRDSQERQTLSPRTDEHTKSGTDDEVAALSDTAYGTTKPRPETVILAAEIEAGEGQSNPLEASGANQELSKPRGDERAEQYKVVITKAERSRVGDTPGKGEMLREYQVTKKIKKLS
ncbi:Nitric oxide synthase-interacting protein [Purpureocillium lavendulum]|uniref:Nitric oxide synthase-interacting protein n=1 Tax=Purpureocillium lavendulum TaxID=1247861 RepID=A0AB34FMD0_9HYPO|nr:Nitric oxide synthase-interacting protein [Purpureocillium lavendulum]